MMSSRLVSSASSAVTGLLLYQCFATMVLHVNTASGGPSQIVVIERWTFSDDIRPASVFARCLDQST
jgi:hypothetical protein